MFAFYVLCLLVSRRPPRSTRTDTLFPSTTRFRSPVGGGVLVGLAGLGNDADVPGLDREGDDVAGELVGAGLLEGADGGHDKSPLLSRSEEHTSELQSLMRISYAVFCLKKKRQSNHTPQQSQHNLSTHTTPTQ